LCEPVDATFQTWLHGIRFLSGAGVIGRAPTSTPTPPCTVPALPSPYSLRVNAGGPAYTDTTRPGPENLGILRRIALNLLKQETTTKAGVKAKRKTSGWDEAYLRRVLVPLLS
jgi:hypothetical protein